MTDVKKPKPKRPSGPSPTQRTMARLREAGWIVGITEKWNPYTKTRQDLWGFIDMLAAKEGEKVLAIQATSYANVSKRVNKIMESKFFPVIRMVMDVQVWGWHKHDNAWKCRVVDMNSKRTITDET